MLLCPLAVSALVMAVALPAGAAAEQAAEPASAAAGQLDAGRFHTCAILVGGSVRCWGYGAEGELGYGSTMTIGDDETPSSAGPVDLGPGRTASAISAGAFHTCALLDDRTVRCWGYGANGRLGYGNTDDIGDNETPGSLEPVNLGDGRTARAISAGYGHTCAVLDDGSVRCWGGGTLAGNGASGDLGPSIGDDETPGSVAPVNLGEGRTATAISAGERFTCALLDNASVRCWGFNVDGRLGYGHTIGVVVPGSVDPVNLGPGRTARAISAGTLHACALLDNGAVRCWGAGAEGALGYGDTHTIGDDEIPASVAPVNLGLGRTATAVSAGRYSCAVLDDATVRCWGSNRDGQLGYGNRVTIGDDETPESAGPVNLGAGALAVAISTSEHHACARLGSGDVRCWGVGTNGRLGACNARKIGDDETPGSVDPVALVSGSCPAAPAEGSTTSVTPAPAPQALTYPLASAPDDGLEAQAARRRGLRGCLAAARRHATSEIRRTRRLVAPRRVGARRHARRHQTRLRRGCLRRHGRTPGPVTGLAAQKVSGTNAVITFRAPGTDGTRSPAAHTYLVKQSRQSIRGSRGFRRAQPLCRGGCRFPSATRVGDQMVLTINDLRRHTTYYYAVAARDNVSKRLGPRSPTLKLRTK